MENKLSQTIPCQYDTIFSPFPAGAFPEALTFLEKTGFTGAELAVAYPHKVNARALYKQLEAHGLACTTISTGQIYGLDGLFLSSMDADIRARAIGIIKGHIELSADLGAPNVTIGLVRGKLEPQEKKALLENLKRALLPCIEYALKHNVTLQIEPINKAETGLLNSTYDVLAFLKELGDPENVGILYDTFHSNLEDGGMAEAIRAAAGKITNVHFADSHRGLPGYGDIDFRAVTRALEETGYTGAYALETLSIPSPEFVNAHCFESLRAVFQ
ncbi:MAG TPA: sugar phosphate isomerase/epimerase family protein [Feifaniaceae bacterium]|nr:sugar phosphate isomerase/epimerase family protein [Feifaniaceae bacterium]